MSDDDKLKSTKEKDLFDLETKKYELEKYKAEQELKLQSKRYTLERYRTKHESRFLNRNLGVLISAAISLSAVLVTLGQVWVAKISKDKELEVASLQKQSENERLDKQKEKELTMQALEQERQWNLSRAKYITENKKAIFEGNPQELKRMSMIIETLFPYDIAINMFEDFKSTAASPEALQVWGSAQERLQKRADTSASISRPARTTANTPSTNGTESSATKGYGTVSVFIVNQKQVPLASVGIFLWDGNEMSQVGQTGNDGRLTLKLPAGTYRFTAARPGYTIKMRMVTVPRGADVAFNETLTGPADQE